MSKRQRLFVAILVLIPGVLSVHSQQGSMAPAPSTPSIANNQCVSCHGNLHDPLEVSTRFFEWQFSKHRIAAVACDACHGGNAAAADKAKAHTGVLPMSNPNSRLYYKNQPETCGSCHQNVVKAFVESTHYQKLKGIGIGPSCNTCHSHMATQVIYSRDALADVCSRCHDTLNLMPARPEIPRYASSTLDAFNRTNSVVQWADMLLAMGEQRNANITAERAALQKSKQTLQTAKLNWHKFQLEGLRPQIDEAYNQSLKVRNELQKKLNMR